MQSSLNVGLAISGFLTGRIVETYGYFALELYFLSLCMSMGFFFILAFSIFELHILTHTYELLQLLYLL